jgi:mono/diheme cytochrome c family protein
VLGGRFVRRTSWAAGVAILGLLAAACGPSESNAPGEQPAPPPAAAPAAPAPAAPSSPPAAPAAAAAHGDAARGAALYQTYCASCHGPRGDGDGPVGASLNPQPAKHSDGSYMNALSNEHLFRVIEEGGAAVGKSPLMAPWGGTLSDEQIRDVVAYVRSLAKPPYAGSAP